MYTKCMWAIQVLLWEWGLRLLHKVCKEKSIAAFCVCVCKGSWLIDSFLLSGCSCKWESIDMTESANKRKSISCLFHRLLSFSPIYLPSCPSFFYFSSTVHLILPMSLPVSILSILFLYLFPSLVLTFVFPPFHLPGAPCCLLQRKPESVHFDNSYM